MCGIAGIIGQADELVDAADVRRMCKTIIHRGPDDEGIYAVGPIGLGMRRLSIIDLAGGRQPVHNEDKSIWVVFNGEIYNFPDLRRELEARGHNFYTHTDTEVIVHLYEELGADCIKKLRGMFAIALYDSRKQKLLLARDRLGKKPLYYAVHHGRLLFGSEIKALLAVAPELAEVNLEALLQFFYFAYIPDPYSAFQRIAKLPPGHLAEYKDGEIRVREYWDIPSYGNNDPGSEEACLEELESRLEEAVRIRLISDVPLGALLSGGVDSSIVVGLMARASSVPVKTFSIGFGKEDFNEAEHARRVAERFGTDHHELVVEPAIGETLEMLSRMMEEPFGDSSIIPTYYVSKLARQHVTVALSGDGGDELFAGYDRYVVNLRRSRYAVPPWLGRMYRNHIYPLLPQNVRGRKFAWNISLPSRDRYLDGLSFLPALHRERSLFTDDFLASVRAYVDPLTRSTEYYDHAPAYDALSRLMYLDTKTYLTGDILTKVDRMSMATSLEVRCPILDHQIVEWVASLPVKYKFQWGIRKYILKKLGERIGVPSALLHRRKQGFSLPLVHWMRHELKDGLLTILAEPRTLQRGYFKREAIQRLLDEHYRGYRDRAGAIWLLLVFELWHRNFLEARRSREVEFVPGICADYENTTVGRPLTLQRFPGSGGEL
ncbi:MAG TPA: asparagine synthase (glutamine-hydrolyzing) [Candidatus Elarobacter sp.]|nr:asparagine synthase (glutamine-hydrolyzing) [Candidatus Elarobacter sp.]